LWGRGFLGARHPCGPARRDSPSRLERFEAEITVGLATDPIIQFSREGKALKIKKSTFTIRASNFWWYPGFPGRPPFRPRGSRVLVQRGEEARKGMIENVGLGGVGRNSRMSWRRVTK